MVSLHRAIVLLSAALLGSASISPTVAQVPRIETRAGHHALIVDGEPFLMLGGQVHNSSNWPNMLPKVWPVIERMGANTVAVPISWEQVEPVEGQFDFSFLDTLLAQARERRVRVIVLWFGTWKNTWATYAPAWVKLDAQRFPRMLNENGEKTRVLSAFGEATLAADRRAFVRMMEHLRDRDTQNTVVMVQVENEIGSYGNPRDHQPAANAAFEAPVPAGLRQAMGAKPGNWRQAFGPHAEEYFQSWAFARYVEQIARAGKAVKPLPMYVNAALSDPFNRLPPTAFASGGPDHNSIPVWKWTAPSIDLLAPDIYQHDEDRYVKFLDLYGRADNALLVPELGNSTNMARFVFPTIGHGAIGFLPFGTDLSGYSNFPLGAQKFDTETIDAFGRLYRRFAPMQAVWAKAALAGKVWGVAEPKDAKRGTEQVMDMGRWKATAIYGLGEFNWEPAAPRPIRDGGVSIAEIGPDEYLVTGQNVRVRFGLNAPRAGEQSMFERVEEGHVGRDGRWVVDRVWNGDQTDYDINFTDRVEVLKIKLGTFH